MPEVRSATLKISETFVSIQGEAAAAGWRTLFIRLTGCPLRCVYCDTEYAFYGGKRMELAELVQLANDSAVRHVCVTGTVCTSVKRSSRTSPGGG